jgi:hypothetical protein
LNRNNDHYMNDIGRQLLNNGHGNHEANLGEVCCENLCDFILCEMYFVKKWTRRQDWVWHSVMQLYEITVTIQGNLTTKTMIVLFDPGSTSSYIKWSVLLPKGTTPTLHHAERKATTLGGETMSSLSVKS